MNPSSPFASSPFANSEFFTPESFNALYLGGIKALFLLAFSLYVLFSIIVVRQVFLMEQTINTPLHAVLKVIAIGHVLVAIFILLLAFLAL